MTIIKVNNLGKRYRLGETRSRLLSENIGKTFRSIFNKAKARKPPQDFWALKDVSFEVQSGEVVGIIGRNGAGKSTLLKILSRITPPTTGEIEMFGRVASLLEVGTGFHPELTGRENIFLNGSILGMSKSEIRKKFDEIVAFAEVEKFIDTPVKRYSSGMYIRLAFAVAAHLEPEILIVDEVLAVGDMAFQKKCLGKMEDVSREGRTVLFVSHNMNSIRDLCSRAILLREGQLAMTANVDDVISNYMDLPINVPPAQTAECANYKSCKYIKNVVFKDDDGNIVTGVRHTDKFVIEITYNAPAKWENYVVAARLTDEMGNILFTSWNKDWLDYCEVIYDETYISSCIIPGNILKPGKYMATIFVRIQTHRTIEFIEEVDFRLTVSDEDYAFGHSRWGLIAPHMVWENKKLISNVKS